jgi:hypothetical protein
MARISKGDRVTVTAKIPAAYAPKLAGYVDATGETRSELIARLVTAHLDSVDLVAERGQERLPLTA